MEWSFASTLEISLILCFIIIISNWEKLSVNLISYHSLETGVEVNQEGRFPWQRQHSLLYHGALYVIILQNSILLECLQFIRILSNLWSNLDCIVVLTASQLCQQHLAKTAKSLIVWQHRFSSWLLTCPSQGLAGIWNPWVRISWRMADTWWVLRFSGSWIFRLFHLRRNQNSCLSALAMDSLSSQWNLGKIIIREYSIISGVLTKAVASY